MIEIERKRGKERERAREIERGRERKRDSMREREMNTGVHLQMFRFGTAGDIMYRGGYRITLGGGGKIFKKQNLSRNWEQSLFRN